MEQIYPTGPVNVPEQLTKPTTSYRNSAWLAMAGLAMFVLLYFALAGWFIWTAYRLFADAFAGDDGFLGFIGGACAAFLGVFMVKAIFFVKHRYEIDDIEVTAEQHPKLFAFLHRLADEARAPRPHRVYLSPRVNASVSYDLSILNLLFPSKKNLEIGLGLVNVLTLGELKAVLAHEFGHFAQRSMAVGRWVYIAQQIAGHIIAKRDMLDTFLNKLSRFDLRIAWVGWLLSLIVWSIRSVMETVFRVVVLAQRALSREMEFQADLVAVSLTGSDALIHALYRLHVADEAWDRALGFASNEARNERGVIDVFTLQTRIIERLRGIFDRPEYGEVFAVPKAQPESHRLFKAQLAQPPRMWSTHPANTEREENAKRTYIAADIDSRSAWDLFNDVTAVRETMSAHIFRAAKTTPAPMEDTLKRLDEEYARAYLNRDYRGAYLGRSVVRSAKQPHELYGVAPTPDRFVNELSALYPDSLATDLEKYQRLQEELAQLEALHDGFLTAPGGIIRHAGKELRRKDLPDVIDTLRDELNAARQLVQAHDKRCRTTHLAAAVHLGNGWDAYLRGLANTLHYADHSEANLRDAQGALGNVYSIVTADGKVSKKELDRLIDASYELYKALQLVHQHAPTITLDRTLLRRLSVENWPQALGKFELPQPSQQNIGEWLQVIDGWTNAAANALSALRLAALEQLLLVEGQIAKFVRSSMKPGPAPEPSNVPSDYPTLVPGMERARQKRLGLWDRFAVADGLVATIARLAVAGGIIAAVVFVGASVGVSTVTIYNGLSVPVNVAIDKQSVYVQPHGKQTLDVERDKQYSVRTTNPNGELIEEFQENVEHGFTHFIYNVASASPLVEWTMVYGNAAERPDRNLGAQRWLTSSATILFEEPPRSVSSKSGGATREVLSSLSDRRPITALNALADDAARKALATTHARWDGTQSKYFAQWMYAASMYEGFDAILKARVKSEPENVALLRLEQDFAKDDARAAVCERHAKLSTAKPENVDLRYIAVRCMEPGDARDAAFLQGNRDAPKNGWFAMASADVFERGGKWNEALPLTDQARGAIPSMSEQLTMDVARLRRISTGNANVSLEDLFGGDENLKVLYDIENGQMQGNDTMRAYQQLSRGQLQTAIDTISRTDAQRSARLLRMVGASEGANPDHIRRALALPATEGLDDDSIWPTLALAMREHAALPAGGRFDQPDVKSIQRFIELGQRGEYAAAEKMLNNTPAWMRGHAMSAATVALGSKTPEAWRKQAKLLLFATERPYFK